MKRSRLGQPRLPEYRMFLWLPFLNSIPSPFVNIGRFGFRISGKHTLLYGTVHGAHVQAWPPALCLGEVNQPHWAQFSHLQFGSSNDDITWVNDVGVWKALCQLFNSIFLMQTVPLFHSYWWPMLPEVGSELIVLQAFYIMGIEKGGLDLSLLPYML